MVVGDDVVVSKVGEDLELGMKLLALLLGHAEVRNFLAAHNKAVRLAANLADDTKGTMAYEARDKKVSRSSSIRISNTESDAKGDSVITHQSSPTFRIYLQTTY